MANKTNSLFEVVFVVLLSALMIGLLIIPSILINAFVVQHLFNWFIPHLFEVNPIEYWPAAGLALVVGWLTYTDTTNLKRKNEGMEFVLESIANNWIVRPALALLIGWAIHGLAF